MHRGKNKRRKPNGEMDKQGGFDMEETYTIINLPNLAYLALCFHH